jgi:hypothetical protein
VKSSDLKCKENLNRIWGYALHYDKVTGFCGYCDEPLRYIKCGVFLDGLVVSRASKRAVLLAVTREDKRLILLAVTNQFECKTVSWGVYLFLRWSRESCVPGPDRLLTPCSRKEKVASEMQRIFSNSFLILKDVVKEVLMSTWCSVMTTARTGSSAGLLP